jgi:hypothetical protein
VEEIFHERRIGDILDALGQVQLQHVVFVIGVSDVAMTGYLTWIQEAQRMVKHGIMPRELEQYVAALLSSSAQQAAAMETTPHIEMMELTMESITNGQVLSSNLQAHEVRHFTTGCTCPARVSGVKSHGLKRCSSRPMSSCMCCSVFLACVCLHVTHDTW